ncbi:MAG: lipid II:glycine glycyltransferase FemX [Syntrophales bacterium]
MEHSSLQVMNPADCPQWDNLLLETERHSFFHASNWAKVLAESYHYKPAYFAEPDERRFRVLVPMMEVGSILTAKRGVSLPFSDYCEMILSEGGDFQYVFDRIAAHGKNAHWKYMEFRCERNFPFEAVSAFYFGHTLDLQKSESAIFSNLHGSTRRNIKKGIREGLKIDVCSSPKAVREFYRLNAMTRKTHGLPPQPWYFFQKICEHIMKNDQGIVVLASYRNQPVGGAMFFHIGKRAIYKYGASDRQCQHLRANNLIMWETIRWYRERGFQVLNFGRTDPGNRGLRRFKTGWGTDEYIIKYFKYNLASERFVAIRPLVGPLHQKIFRSLPVPFLRLIGNIFYRHAG